jgi:hypothetical protein
MQREHRLAALNRPHPPPPRYIGTVRLAGEGNDLAGQMDAEGSCADQHLAVRQLAHPHVVLRVVQQVVGDGAGEWGVGHRFVCCKISTALSARVAYSGREDKPASWAAILADARSYRETEPQIVLLHGKAKVTTVAAGRRRNLAEGSRSRTYPSLSDRPCRF